MGDKNLLKANLAKGVLEIQLALIQLYTDNLNSIGTQAALLASFAFTGITSTPYPQAGLVKNIMEFFYFGCMALSFGTALFALSQATVVTTYGPAMALSGNNAASVKTSAGHMKLQQDFVFKVGFICISSFFVAAIGLTWARRNTGQATMNCLIYLFAYAVTVVKGFQVYKSVNAYGSIESDDEAILKKEASGHGKDDSSNVSSYNLLRKSDEESELVAYPNQMGSVVSHSEIGRSVKAMGQLWMRDSIDHGGRLHERFAVLQRGVLEIYRTEKDYEKGKAPINELPFQLRKYALELDVKKFNRGMTSGRKTFRRMVSGQGEISLPLYVASEFDLKTAVKKYRFILYPKILSEVNPLPTGEFMANDEQSYKQWIEAIQNVISTAEDLAQNKIVNRAMSGKANIDLVEEAVASYKSSSTSKKS